MCGTLTYLQIKRVTSGQWNTIFYEMIAQKAFEHGSLGKYFPEEILAAVKWK